MSAAHILYLPVLLAVGRLYYCESTSHRLSCDPSVECGSTQHTLAMILCAVLVGLPYVTYRYIEQSIVYKLAADHEKRLQVWEILYMLNIDDTFDQKQLWLSSSFVREHAYFRFDMLMWKVCVLLVFLFVRGDESTQAALLWVILSGFSIKYLICRPFRTMSSNMFLMCLCAVMLTAVWFGLFNALGVQTAVLVASTQTLWLLTIHCLGALAILVIVVLSVLNPYALAPADATLAAINCYASNRMIKMYNRWVCTLHNYHRFRRMWYTGTRLNVDIIGIETLIQVLRQQWLSARSKASLFEVPITEALEDLLIMRSFVPRGQPAAGGGGGGTNVGCVLRRKECWNRTCDASSTNVGAPGWGIQKFASAGPYDAANPRVLEDTLTRRHEMFVLMNAKKKRMMQKLLALSALMGGRKIDAFDSQGMSAEDAERNWVLQQDDRRRQYEDSVVSAHGRIAELVSKSDDTLRDVKKRLKTGSSLELAVSNLGSNPTPGAEDAIRAGCAAYADTCVKLQATMSELIDEWNQVITVIETTPKNQVSPDEVLRARGLTPHSADFREEWYTYRMLLSDQVRLLDDPPRLPEDSMVQAGDYDQINGDGDAEAWDSYADDELVGGEGWLDNAEMEGMLDSRESGMQMSSDVVLPQSKGGLEADTTLAESNRKVPFIPKLDTLNFLQTQLSQRSLISASKSKRSYSGDDDLGLDALDTLPDDIEAARDIGLVGENGVDQSATPRTPEGERAPLLGDDDLEVSADTPVKVDVAEKQAWGIDGEAV